MRYERIGAQITVLLFAVLFIAGLAATFSYGQPWDEPSEIDIFISNIKEYLSRTGLRGGAAAVFEEHWIPKISEYMEKDHGMAVYYPFLPVYLAVRSSPSSSMYAWHMYTFCIFFSGVLAVFLILRELFSRPLIRFGGMLSYYLTPRFFAEGHYNNKDIVFVSVMLWALYFLIRTARTGKRRYLAGYSVSSAFLMNCKISGVAIWAAGTFFLFLYRIIRGESRRAYRETAGCVLFSLLAYYALTPASWGQPVQFLQYCLENATHFNRWNRVILFNGDLVQPAVTGLPRSYLPLWILISTPGHVLLLYAVSCALYGIRALKRLSARFRHLPLPALRDRDFFAGMMMCLFWLPFAYLVYKSHTLVLYNGWRHCYFLYVPIILHFLYALEPTGEEKGRREHPVRNLLLCGVLALGLFSVTADLITYHPFEYVYFNRVSRSLLSAEDFEGDYWNVSTLEVLRRFEDEFYQGEKLKVFLYADAGAGQNRKLLDDGRILLTEEAEADYFLINISALHDRTVLSEYEPVSWVERSGSVISGVYVKKELLR